jgi:hypothetical protein
MSITAATSHHRRRSEMRMVKTEGFFVGIPGVLRVSVIVFAATILGACDTEGETLTGGVYDPQGEALAKAPPVELPPAIKASRTYRCKDNSLLYADFYTNDSARIWVGSRDAAPVSLNKSPSGAGFEGSGYTVSGSDGQISFAAPGSGNQSCKS